MYESDSDVWDPAVLGRAAWMECGPEGQGALHGGSVLATARRALGFRPPLSL